MKQNFNRNIVYYKHYYLDFFQEQTEAVKLKFNWTLGIIATMECVPDKFFKHIDDGIYKVRVEVGSNTFRVFSFFDEGQLISSSQWLSKEDSKNT